MPPDPSAPKRNGVAARNTIFQVNGPVRIKRPCSDSAVYLCGTSLKLSNGRRTTTNDWRDYARARQLSRPSAGIRKS